MKLTKLVALLLLPVASYAMPEKYTECGKEINIKHPEDIGNGVYFNKSCSVAYVLPPKVGKISNITAFGNLTSKHECSAIETLKKTNDSVAELIMTNNKIRVELQNELRDDILERKTLEKEIKEYKLKLAKKKPIKRSLSEKLKELKTQYAEKKKQWEQEEQINLKYVYQLEMEKLQETLNSAKSEFSSVEGDIEYLDESIKLKAGFIKAIEKDMMVTDLKLGNILSETSKVQDLVTKKLNPYSTKKGINLNFEYDLDHAGLVNQYIDLNPDAKVSFRKLNPKFTQLSLNINASNDITGDYRMDVPATTASKAKFEKGMFLAGASSGTMNASLNKVATCSLLKEGTSEIDLSKVKDSKYLTLQNIYLFELAGKSGYYSRFNVKELYERIKSSGTKGGFFSKRRWTKVVNNSEFDALFTVDFYSDDSDVNFTQEMQTQIIKDIKAEAMDNLFKEFLTMASNDGKLPIPRVPEDNRPTGAAATADALDMCPNLYCQVGAKVLRAVDSLIGSNKATNHFKDTKRFTYEKKVGIQQMYLFHGSTGYVY